MREILCACIHTHAHTRTQTMLAEIKMRMLCARIHDSRLTIAGSKHVAGPCAPWAEQRSVACALARVACLDAAVAARVSLKALTKAAVAVGPAAAPMACSKMRMLTSVFLWE